MSPPLTSEAGAWLKALGPDQASLIAAAQASEAVTELLRYHREGPASDTAFGDVNVIELLAEALALACQIERAVRSENPQSFGEARYTEAVMMLEVEARDFVESWGI